MARFFWFVAIHVTIRRNLGAEHESAFDDTDPRFAAWAFNLIELAAPLLMSAMCVFDKG